MAISKVTLFCGLNDKDSKVQEITTVEAYKIAQRLATEKFGGCTISEAVGVYRHDDGTIVTENTLRIEILGATVSECKPYINDLKKVFNQECIAVQYEQVNSELM